MTDSDRDYYQARAAAELELASRSENPAVVKCHYLLAGHYLDRIHGKDVRDHAEPA
jgi:hypothetical protein